MSIPPPPHLQPPQPPSYYDSLMMLAGVDAIDTTESLPLQPVKAPNATRPPNKLNTTANNKDDMPKAPKSSIKEMAERSSAAAASREDDIEYDDTLSAEQIAALERATLEESDYAYPPPAPDGYDEQADKLNHLLLAHPDSDLTSEINKGNVNPNIQPENAALAYQNLVYGSLKPLVNHTGSPLPGAYDFVNAPPPAPHQFPQSPMSMPTPASPMTPGTPSALGQQQQGTPNKPPRPPPATRQSTNTSSQFKSEECPICHRTFKGPKASTHKQQHVRRMHPAHYIPKRGGKKRADSPPTPNSNELNKSLYTSLAQQATSSYQQ